MKPDDVKIIQIVVQDKSLIGLGDDGNLYRKNYQTGEWTAV